MESTTNSRPALHGRRRLLAGTLVPIGVAASIAGMVFDLYDRVSWFDEVLHTFNFFAATLLVGLYSYGRVLSGVERHRALLFAVLLAVGLGLGAVWETVEWAYDQIRNPNLILGKTDTILDLLVDGGGAAVGGLMVLVRSRGEPKLGD